MLNLASVDRRNPINWRHPLNRDKCLWMLALPNMSSGPNWIDITGFNSVIASQNHGTGPFNKWTADSGTGRDRDGVASMYFQGETTGSQGNFTYVSWGNLPATQLAASSYTLGISYNASNTGTLFDIAETETVVDLAEYAGPGPSYYNGSSWGSFGTASPTGWTRLILVFNDTTDTITAYINGVPTANTLPGPIKAIFQNGDGFGSFLVGCQLNGNAPLQGEVDDFFISRALWTAEDVAEDYAESQANYPGMLNRIPSSTMRAIGGLVSSGPATLTVTATTAINLQGTGSGYRPNSTWNATATTQVTLGGLASGTGVGGGPRDVSASCTTSMALQGVAGVGTGRIGIVSASTGLSLSGIGNGGPNAYYSVGATTSLNLSSSASEYVSPIHASASNILSFTSPASVAATRTQHGDAVNTLTFNPQADSDGQIRNISVSAADSIAFEPDTEASQIRIITASAVTGFNLYSNIGVNGARNVSASTAMAFTNCAAKLAAYNVSATDTIAVEPLAVSGGRVVSVSATTSMGMATDQTGADKFLPLSSTSAFSVSYVASATIGYNNAPNTIAFGDLATASVTLPDGGFVPGGDSNAGLRAVAYPVVSGYFPFSYAETPSGLLLIANGVDPMLRWNGLSGLADTAGIQPPSNAIAMGGQDVGTLVGMRYAYCRFVDNSGNVSALSPLSNAVNLGRDAFIEDIAINASTGLVTIQATAHGLASTDSVVIQGVTGLAISGIQLVTTVDPDHFTLANLRITGGVWTGGGSWTWGVAEVVYQNVPVSLESKVVRRQILRNLDGSADVFYVDIDTTDLISGMLTSTRCDEALSACESVPIVTANELPYASRYAPPPNHKSVVVSHSGRMFACAEVTITLGNVIPLFGSNVVFGVGTAWKATLAGRFLYVTGATQAYEIASVNVAAQSLTLVNNYGDPTQPYATYAIRPAPGERRLVYYTEPGLPESWPPWNSFAIPEDNDEIVGMFSRTGFLYFVEQRHIHRFTMQDEPSEGQTFPSIDRGCINNRCFVQVENTTYLLDEAGIHAFDGSQATEPISTPIQTIFQSDGLLGGLMVDWSADTTLWHGVIDAVRTTIRWFVQMVGYDDIYHAISYDYRQKRWWIEQYPTPITSSTTGIVGYRRSLVGTDARRVLVLGEGALDLVAESGPNYGGSVSAADSTSLTDGNASFPSNLGGAPVSIVFGTGRGQQSMIAENTSTQLTIVEPWDTIPDGTSTYQVGGVNWTWRSGWFEYVVEGEDENPRNVSLTYQPTINPATVDMQLFFDHSPTPFLWDFAVGQDGIEVIPNDPNITVSLMTRGCRSGWSMQRFGGHSEVYGYGTQYMQLLLVGVQCSESIRIFQVTLDGVRTGEES